MTQGFEVECIIRKWDENIINWATNKDDGSIRGNPCGGLPIEFPTIPASGTKQVELVTGLTTCLENMAAYVNSSCGLHVHTSIEQFTREQQSNIRMWWRLFEPIIFAAVLPWRRASSFCRPIGHAPDSQWIGGRYFALNVSTGHRTYELRLPEPSLDPDYILFWLSLTNSVIMSSSAAPPDTSVLVYLTAATDREILRKFLEIMRLPSWTTRRLVALLHANGANAWSLAKSVPELQAATIAPAPIELISIRDDDGAVADDDDDDEADDDDVETDLTIDDESLPF